MSDARRQLREAWDGMMAELERARDAIDQPELMPAPGNDRNLAEGYRYLLGYVHSAIERAFHADVDGVAGITNLGVGGLSLFYGTEESVEGRNAFMEKRKADFGKFRT